MHEDRRELPLWGALVIAILSGPVLDAGFPDRGIWPLTFLGIALVLMAIRGRAAGSSLLVGFVAGLSFYLTHIDWAALFLGPLPMSALATLESLFFAAGALTITWAYRWIDRVTERPVIQALLVSFAVAGLWTAREAWASVWPYGGFAWGRVALSQSESPLNSLFSWVGVSGVSFVMVLLVAMTIEVLRRSDGARLTGATIVTAVAIVAFGAPAFAVPTEGTIRVLAVQGNGKAGYFDKRERGDLLRAQVEATLPYSDEQVDVVLWPEGGSDLDPSREPFAGATFDAISREFDAPLVAGVVTQDGETIYNSSVLWRDGEGVVDQYNKRHPVPFGEYIPDRAFWRPFAPDLIDLVQREYTPGTTDGILDLGGVKAGVNICFDIVDDQLLTETVRDGAQVLFAQSNNADFGRTDESVQQLAIARVRALELGRTVVNISTVGTSAIIAPDGSTIDELEWYTQDVMLEDVPLATVLTPAAVGGRYIEWFVSAMAIALVLGAALHARITRDG